MANSVLRERFRRTLMIPKWAQELVGRVGLPVGLALLGLALLEWALPLMGVPTYLIPPPSRVLARLLDPATTLYSHGLATASAALLGLIGGALLGVGLALSFALLPPLGRALYPWVLVSQALPVAALAPLLTIWFGNGLAPRAAMAGLFAFFPVLVGFAAGLRRPSAEQLAVLRAWGATPLQELWLLRLPAGLPGLLSGLRIGAALAVAGAIVGELAGAGRGLGFAISIAVYHLQTDTVFAAVTLAAAMSLALHGAIGVIERKVTHE